MQRPGFGTSSFTPIALAYFFLLSLVLFGDALFNPDWVISAAGMDIDGFFYPLRTFAFGEMKQGNLPLWNPYILGGIPAMGNTLYALLYPPNWLHLVLPMGFAINLLIAVHMMLAGLFTAAWCRMRGASIPAALLGGTVFMLSGPNTLRVYGGYLTHACIIVYTPLIFICIDRIIDNRRPAAASLWGAAAVAMQIYAGYMQPTYFQFFGICTYFIVRMIRHPRPLACIGWFAMMFSLGGALCAVQLLPAIDAASESVRGTFELFAFSTSFSIAPENVLLSIMPHLLGDWVTAPVFVRWGVVDTSIFMGVVGTSLAIVGTLRARTTSDAAVIVTAVAMLLLSMGGYYSFYKILLMVVPGLELFRFPSRFAFITTFMAAPLAAAGFDYLRQTRRVGTFICGTALVSLVLGVAAVVVYGSRQAGFEGAWGQVLRWLVDTGETFHKLDRDDALRIIAQSAEFAATELTTAAGIFAMAALIAALAWRRPAAITLLLALAVLELCAGSSLMGARFRPTTQLPRQWTTPLSQREPESRVLVLSTGNHNLPMQFGFESVGGYDPAVRQRWDGAIRPLLGSEARTGNLNTRRVVPSRRWEMVRLGTVVPPNPDIRIAPPLPRLHLVERFSVVPAAEDSLLAIRHPQFDPWKSVILEQRPSPSPAEPADDSPPGQVELLHFSTDAIEFNATLTRPAILLLTDAYSKGWRAWPLTDGPQAEYVVLPANHCLRAIPLTAGNHHIRMEYRPPSYMIGMVITAGSFVAWCGGLIVTRRRKLHL